VTGGVGYLGARPSQQVFDACDTLLIVGSTFPYIEYYPKPDRVRSVQIDIDAARIGLRFPVEGGVVGDAAAALRALTERLAASVGDGGESMSIAELVTCVRYKLPIKVIVLNNS